MRINRVLYLKNPLYYQHRHGSLMGLWGIAINASLR